MPLDPPLDPRSIEVMDECMVPILRALSGEVKMRTANGMIASARIILGFAVAKQHPDWNERQVHAEVVRRFSHGLVRPLETAR